MAIDMSRANAPTPPPARRATTAKKATPAPAPQQGPTKSLNEQRFEGIMGIAQLGQLVCLGFGLHADAATIGQKFPPVAQELANIADDNEHVSGPIDFLIKVSPYVALATVAVPFVAQIAANHKLIDASKAGPDSGIVPPEVLEAQMKAQIARMQLEAQRAHHEAILESQRIEAEYMAMMREYEPAEAQ